MEFSQKKNCEIDLFYFMSFFGLDFFKFSVPLCANCNHINIALYFYFLAHCVLRRFEKKITIHMAQIQWVLKKSTLNFAHGICKQVDKKQTRHYFVLMAKSPKSQLRTKLDVCKNPKTFFVG